jgi:UDP-N-acetylmuramate--alanine ligase
MRGVGHSTAKGLLAEARRLHFIGIGGAGMSGLAELSLRLGFAVSGCDLCPSPTVTRLAGIGAKVAVGHDPNHISRDLSAVVFSSAVDRSNPELIAAQRAGVPVIPRAEMLGELLRLARFGIAIAGAHGKTTTTSFVATILEAAGLDPTVAIGGNLRSSGTNVRLGSGEIMVAEADESDASFLMLLPTVALVTNIDAEHLDYYGTTEHLREAFLSFVNRVPFYGFAVLGIDSPHVRGLLGAMHKRAVTYGAASDADFRATDIEIRAMRTEFVVIERGRRLGVVSIPLPGLHVALNALGAIALAREMGIGFELAAETLAGFPGIARRFELKGEAKGRLVLDDYAHHPTEIRATLAAARAAFGRRLVVVFQPHRYTRLRNLFEEFVSALADADRLYLMDVYSAGEQPITGISSRALYDALAQRGHPPTCYLDGTSDGAGQVAAESAAGDLIVTLGAGNVYALGERVLKALEMEG